MIWRKKESYNPDQEIYRFEEIKGLFSFSITWLRDRYVERGREIFEEILVDWVWLSSLCVYAVVICVFC